MLREGKIISNQKPKTNTSKPIVKWAGTNINYKITVIMKELIEEMAGYIKLLEKHLGNHEAFMSNRGGYAPDKKAVQEGKDRRKRIKDLCLKIK